MHITMTLGDAALNLGLGLIAIAMWAWLPRIYDRGKDFWRERSSASAANAVRVLEHEKAEFEGLLAKPEDYQRRTFLYVRRMIWLSFNTLAFLLFTVLVAITIEFDKLKTPPHPEELRIDVGFAILTLLGAYVPLILLSAVHRRMGRHLNPTEFFGYVNTKIERMKKRASR